MSNRKRSSTNLEKPIDDQLNALARSERRTRTAVLEHSFLFYQWALSEAPDVVVRFARRDAERPG